MDKVRLLLTLITISIVVVPIVGMLLVYQNNLLGLIIPPEAEELIDTLSSGGGGSDGPLIEPVGTPQYDEASRTVTMSFQFTNTFPFNVTLNSMSGDVECVAHGTHLGVATLDKKVSIGVGETKTITVLGVWTDEAISHIKEMHAGEKTIDANVIGFTVNVKGIILQMDQMMEIPNPFA